MTEYVVWLSDGEICTAETVNSDEMKIIAFDQDVFWRIPKRKFDEELRPATDVEIFRAKLLGYGKRIFLRR